MNDLPELTEADVRAWTDPRSFERGDKYYRQGHILRPSREGTLLKAGCIGSRLEPYRIEMMLAPTRILAGDCSCPVGGGGHCKHAVALLLTWVHEPDAFATVDDLEAALGGLSKAQLIAIIHRMLNRYPDLRGLVELPVFDQVGEPPPVDADMIRRHARDAFARISYDDWDCTYDVAHQLFQLVGIGDDYAKVEQWHDASTIYQAVMEETFAGYGLVRDESRYLHQVVDDCVDGLEACLMAAEDASRRAALLEALCGVYRWDLGMGGIDMGVRAPGIILEQATAEERRMVAGWLQAALPDDYLWARPACGSFLLRLGEPWLTDEAFLRICRETGLHAELVERLTMLGRVDEAVKAVAEAPHFKLPDLADILVAHGWSERAERLVRNGADRSPDWRLVAWLKERAQARGDYDEALALGERLFWRNPNLEGYHELREAAAPTGRWPEVRRAVVARLAEQDRHLRLIEIYLHDEDVDRALETLEQMRDTRQWRQVTDWWLALVARAAERERPEEAIRLYTETVKRLIARRGRYNYATAAEHLRRVRALYGHLDEEAAWLALMAGLRQEHRRLPALQDELDKAGL